MKPWYKSKGVWLGVLSALTGSIDVIVNLLQHDDMNVMAIVLAVSGVLKVWERFAKNDLTAK